MSSVYLPSGGMQSVPCQRCHAPLLPNEATCRNCGYYNAPAQGNNPAVQGAPSVLPMTPPSFASQRPSGLLSGGLHSPGSAGPVARVPYGVPPSTSQRPSGLLSSTGQGGLQSFAPSPAGPVSQAPYGAPPAGFQQFGAPTVPVQQFPATGPFNASRTQVAGPQAFSTGMAASPSSPDVPRFAKPQEPVTRRRMKPRMVALIVLLVIVLVGGAFVGYTLISKQNNAATTPTTVTTGATKGALLFTDTFQNNAHGWSLQADPGIYSISLAAGSLVIEDDHNEQLWEPLPGNKTFSDFTLSADAMLSRGDQTNGYGFYIRGSSTQNSEWATYYRFELYGDGSYAIFKGDANGKPTNAKLVNYTLNSAIRKQGSVNHVTITAKGSTLSLVVNGQLVKTITDISYTTGAIAPFVSNMQNAKPGAQARFSNLTISGV